MSKDESVTEDLVQTLEDGKDGYQKAAEKLADDSPDIAKTMRGFSEQRAQFAEELKGMAQSYGDKVDDSGSATASVHRGWIAMKDALSGSDPDGVLKAAVQGEDHAVEEYEKAVDEDISPKLKTVVQRQLSDITAARDQVEALADRSR